MTDQEIITMAGEYGAWLNGTEIVFTDRGLVEFARALGKAEKQDVDWEAVAADQAMKIAMLKSEQAEFQELVAKVQELEKQACEIIRRGADLCGND